MKVNLNKSFKDLKGNDISGEKMSDMIARALYLGHGVPDDPDSKYTAYRLCIKLVTSALPPSPNGEGSGVRKEGSAGEIEINESEAVLISKAAAKTLTPGAYGQIIDLITTNHEY
jgi:hypothetical protein